MASRPPLVLEQLEVIDTAVIVAITEAVVEGILAYVVLSCFVSVAVADVVVGTLVIVGSSLP